MPLIHVAALHGCGCLSAGPVPSNQALAAKAEAAWRTVVDRFHAPGTSLFYTTPPDYVPSAAGYARCEPNIHASGTGGEDCAMFGGILLAAVCDQHLATGAPSLHERAARVCRGLVNLATVHGEPGFIARGICVEDGRSVYPGSSRDQFTHVVHGLWRYHHSPLSTPAEQRMIREILQAVADKMIREVTFANGYSFRFIGGVPDDRGVSRMRNVRVHEAARLPMFHAAAWDVGRNEEHRAQWRELLPLAVHQSLDFAATPEAELRRWVPPYAVLQMQASLELLLAVEPEKPLAEALRRALREVAEYAERSPIFALEGRGSRDRAEVIEGQLMSPDYRLSESRERLLRQSLADLDPAREPAETYPLLGAYWRARREGLLDP